MIVSAMDFPPPSMEPSHREMESLRLRMVLHYPMESLRWHTQAIPRIKMDQVESTMGMLKLPRKREY